MKINNRKLNKLISKSLNETLEEKANKIVSKLKSNINELGGMTPDSQDTEHPFYNLGPNVSRKEMAKIMKDYYGKDDFKTYEDEEEETKDWEEIDLKGMRDDESEEMKSFKKRKDYGDEEEEEDEEDFYDEEQESDNLEEGWDSEEMYMQTDGEDYNPRKYKKFPKITGIDNEMIDDMTGSEPHRFMFNDIKRHIKRKRDLDNEYGDEEFVEGKGESCEQCGGGMNEGECTECGYKMENIYDVDDIDDENEFDYVEEEMNEDMEDYEDYEEESGESESDIVRRKCEEYGEDSDACKKHKQYAKMDGELDEKLYGNQHRLDHNKNGRIDSDDLRTAREMKGKKTETKEGKKFPDLSGDGKVTRKDILMGRGVKLGNKKQTKEKTKGDKNVKESVRLSEKELLNLIEGVILEQKEKLKNKGGQPRGLQKYKQAHEKSGKENKDYLSSVGKKMKDYLKDGSKGDFEMNPKHFPKGNGELAKMKKKAYSISDDGKEFLDRYQRPGMENLDYDEIHPNEDWMKDTIEGSERTANSSKYANAVETDVNKNINKKREQNEYAKAKRAAFQKSAQPVINDKTGDEDGTGLHINLGKSNKKSKKVNEEFDRMKDLISYDRKTQ